jgi:hypothetical protein
MEWGFPLLRAGLEPSGRGLYTRPQTGSGYAAALKTGSDGRDLVRLCRCPQNGIGWPRLIPRST